MNIYEEKYNKAVKDIKAGKRISPLKAIRLKCLDCCCYQSGEVSACGHTDCVLFGFRMGKNPVKRTLSEKQKENIKRLSDKNRGRG